MDRAGKPLYTSLNILKYGTSDLVSRLGAVPVGKKMEQEEKKSLATFLSDDEVKVVWREDSNLDKPPKVGRGKILNDDDPRVLELLTTKIKAKGNHISPFIIQWEAR